MRPVRILILSIGLAFLVPCAQAQWTPAKRLTWTSGRSSAPAVAADSSNHLHVVWQDDTPGNSEIYYKRSLDGGATWATNKRLTWSAGGSDDPAMVVDSSGGLHVVWHDDSSGNDEIYYKKSTDGGAAWTTSRRLTWNSGGSFIPAIAVDPSNHLHVVWYDNTSGNLEIYCKRSVDGGATWTASQRITWTSGGSLGPAVAADSSGRIHVVWYDDTPGSADIYYKRSTDGGTTWTTNQRLTRTSGWTASPAIAIGSSGHIQLVWVEDVSGVCEYDIFYKRSTDGGANWTASQRITWVSGSLGPPDVATYSSGRVHAVWGASTPGNDEIYYKKSTDGGATWTTSERLTWTSGGSYIPAIAIDSSGHIHVVWHDETPGNPEIYYKKWE